jgi:CheY-like chemotaxis protein
MPLILIVDDRQTNRAIFSKLMEFLDDDVTVHTLGIPMDGLGWLESNTPDLVIVDYSMPAMTGAEFTKRLRGIERLKSVPVIIITAYGDITFEVNALEAGASDFVRSPVDHFDFMSKAKSLLQGDHSRAASRQGQFAASRKARSADIQSLRILIAEPDEFSRKLIERILTKVGHRCETVVDAEDALDELEARTFDLVFMSTSPDYVAALEATKLYRFIALDRDHVPIVALIDESMPNFGRRCLEAGMDDFLVRPASHAALLEITQRVAYPMAS